MTVVFSSYITINLLTRKTPTETFIYFSYFSHFLKLSETLSANVPLRRTLYSLRRLCPPGREAEDSVPGDQRGELPFQGEQNEARDPLPGAGEVGLPADRGAHALLPSLRQPDRCGDDPDQNGTQRKSQTRRQEALTATGGLERPPERKAAAAAARRRVVNV